MLKNVIKYLTLSDVHLFHRKNTTENIIKNLDLYFDYYTHKSKFSNIDILFIAGDLFDTLLDFASEEIYDVMAWLARVMNFCLRFNIKFRILEGTPSHDWKQSRVSKIIYQLLPEGLDFKYIDTLSIEHIKDLGINVLYMPDEWTDSPDKTYAQVQVLLKDNNLTQVDIGIFHGMFEYQLKDVPGNLHKHNEYNYLNIVKYFINIGHIHTYSVYERIIAQGSFDRLSHNEEEAKGGVLCTISKDGNNHFDFIENKNARIFKTILLKNNDLDKSMLKISKDLKGIPDDSFIRIKANKTHPIYIAMDELRLRYPQYTFSKISIEDDIEKYESLKSSVDIGTNYTPITITSDNIKECLLGEIVNKYDLTDSKLSMLNEIIEINR